MFEIELFICIKMDLALNNLQWSMCHKTKPNQTKQNRVTKPLSKWGKLNCLLWFAKVWHKPGYTGLYFSLITFCTKVKRPSFSLNLPRIGRGGEDKVSFWELIFFSLLRTFVLILVVFVLFLLSLRFGQISPLAFFLSEVAVNHLFFFFGFFYSWHYFAGFKSLKNFNHFYFYFHCC